MARRKRASMREGPLADLFRSTTKPEEDEQESRAQRDPATRGRGAEEAAGGQSEDATRVMRDERAPEPGETPPDPERVRAFRVEEQRASEAPPEPRERLSRIFSDELHGQDPSSY